MPFQMQKLVLGGVVQFPINQVVGPDLSQRGPAQPVPVQRPVALPLFACGDPNQGQVCKFHRGLGNSHDPSLGIGIRTDEGSNPHQGHGAFLSSSVSLSIRTSTYYVPGRVLGLVPMELTDDEPLNR